MAQMMKLHTDAYDGFIDGDVRARIESSKPIPVGDRWEAVISADALSFVLPLRTAEETKMMGETYAATVRAKSVEIRRRGCGSFVANVADADIVAIPLMIGSALESGNGKGSRHGRGSDNRDTKMDGTFIIDGRRKYIPLRVFEGLGGEGGGDINNADIKLISGGRIRIRNVPIFIIFRALGIISDRSILDHILAFSSDPLLTPEGLARIIYPSILDASSSGAFSEDAAIAYVSRVAGYETDEDGVRARHWIRRNVFASEPDFRTKAIRLGFHIMRSIVEARNSDFRNIRIRDARDVLADWYSSNFAKIAGDNILRIMSSGRGPIEYRFQNTTDYDKGVFSDLDVCSRTEYASVMARVEGIQRIEAHMYGFVCPLTRCLAWTCGLSSRDDWRSTDEIVEMLMKMPTASSHSFVSVRNFVVLGSANDKREKIEKMDGRVYVYVNAAEWCGYVSRDANEFVDRLREMRRDGSLPTTTSIAWDVLGGRISIDTRHGRLCRPVVSRSDNQTNIMDSAEISTSALISSSDPSILRSTHTEAYSTSPLSATALASFTYVDHRSFSPRLPGQDVIGVLGGGDMSELQYPQRPIVFSSLNDYNEHNEGHNVIVAVLSYGGMNGSGQIIFSKAAADRGLLRVWDSRKDGTDTIKDGSDVLVGPSSLRKSSVSMVLSAEDMPYCSSTGLVPDIIVNPHDAASLASLGLPFMLESERGSDACMRACRRASVRPFAEGISKKNEPNHPAGQVMIFVDPRTGVPMRIAATIGVVYAHRLRRLSGVSGSATLTDDYDWYPDAVARGMASTVHERGSGPIANRTQMNHQMDHLMTSMSISRRPVAITDLPDSSDSSPSLQPRGT